MTIHYHVSIHWVIANQRAVLTLRDSQQPIRDHAPTWRRMGVYFTLYILLTVLSHGLHGFIFLLYKYNYDYLYFILFIVFKILSSFVRDSSYHDMYYKGCGLLCAHKKSFNTAIPVRSLGPYMYVHYCTYINLKLHQRYMTIIIY